MSVIYDNLMTHKRMELIEAAFRMGVPGERSYHRADWAREIEKSLRDTPSVFRLCLGGEVIRSAHQCMLGGRLAVPNRMADSEDLILDAMEELWSFGLARHTRSAWEIAPQARELLTLDEEESQLLDNVDNVLGILGGWLRLYGILNTSQIEQLMHMEENAAAQQLMTIYHRRVGLRGMLGDDQTLWAVNVDAENPKQLLTDDFVAQRLGISLAEYSGDDMINAIACGIPRCSGYQVLMELGRKGGRSDQEIWDTIYEASVLLQNEDSQSALAVLEELDGGRMPPSWRITLILRALNDFPRWTFKGHSARAMIALTRSKSAPQPKPEDPCPCGSGKKYLHCCGRLH